ncbi:diguanylate cyclase (GGDEF)-like protein [Actimicrobium sp. GrIS 1.19]|uniref:GGDEF domain-containing protein n=1 Tax=Actimicrobium sp. GrIS 1.19 TaxID=3071708 RepID=UPI002DFB0AF2|nr:diguanylate cyclase (GGDEF)-like protein [Actimicrobium sp. GrIS 1.19]
MAAHAKSHPHTRTNPLLHDAKKRSFWIVIKRCIQIAALIDCLFFILFYVIGSPIQAWISAIALAMYACAWRFLSQRKNGLAILMIWLESPIHAAIGTVLAGWESGFHYYLLMFIPTMFISNTRTWRSVAAVFGLWIFYVGLNVVTTVLAPLEPLQPGALTALRYFNITAVFCMFGYLSFYYYRTIVDTQNRLNLMATTDPLTELFNRRYMTEMANYEANQQLRHPHGLAVIICDIDHFKTINDRWGHDGGDRVLVTVSKAITQSIRSQDCAARWGGEEFLILLPNTDLAGAVLVAERIREKVAALAIAAQAAPAITVTMTLGVSSWQHGNSMTEAITRADALLYQGKLAGRNRVVSTLNAPQSEQAAGPLFGSATRAEPFGAASYPQAGNRLA